MPFQPTYPKPYNEGVDITNEDGISFECTVDEYDTIVNAELYVKDINSNETLLMVTPNFSGQYGTIENFSIPEEELKNLEVGAKYKVEFEQPNLPYIYSIDSSEKIELLQKGTQYYTYDSNTSTYSPLTGTYECGALMVRGRANGFTNGYGYTPNPYEYGSTNLTKEGYGTIYSKLNVTFNEEGVPTIDVNDTSKFKHLFGGSGAYGLIYVYPPYTLTNVFKSPKVTEAATWDLGPYFKAKIEAEGEKVGLAYGTKVMKYLITNVKNGPYPKNYFTEVSCRPYGLSERFYQKQGRSSYNSVIYGEEKKRIGAINIDSLSNLESLNARDFGVTASFEDREEKRTNGSETYYRRITAPIGDSFDYVCPQAIAIPLVNQGKTYSNSSSSSSMVSAGDIRIINPGYGYPANSSVSGKVFSWSSTDNVKNITLQTNEFGQIDKLSAGTTGTIGLSVSVENDEGKSDANIANVKRTYTENFLNFPTLIPPPPPHTATFSLGENGEIIDLEFENNYEGYLVPPSYFKIVKENGIELDNPQTVGIISSIKQSFLSYSIDGGKTFLDEDSSVLEGPEFPIIGGRGDESRMMFLLQSTLNRKIFNSLEGRQLTWYLKLYGNKEDVFVFSHQNFKKIRWGEGEVYLAVLGNNSNIGEGSIIFKHYRGNDINSELMGVENQFKGINIGKTDPNSKAYEETNEHYILTLYGEGIEIPYSPYISSSLRNECVYEGMKCLVNGLEYEVAKFGFTGDNITSIYIAKTNSEGVAVDPGAFEKNQRVEIYRNKCLGQLVNSSFDLETYDTYTIWTNSILTQQYYFATNNGQICIINSNTPKLNSLGENNEESPWVFTSCKVDFSGAYDGELMWHKWELYKSKDGINYELIKDTGEICSTDLNVNYDGLDAGVEYKVKLIVSNNLSQVVEEEKIFKIGEDAIVDRPEDLDFQGYLFIVEKLKGLAKRGSFTIRDAFFDKDEDKWLYTCYAYIDLFSTESNDIDPAYDIYRQEFTRFDITSSLEELLFCVSSFKEEEDKKTITLCFSDEVAIEGIDGKLGKSRCWEAVFKWPKNTPELGQVDQLFYCLTSLKPVDNDEENNIFREINSKVDCNFNALQLNFAFDEIIFEFVMDASTGEPTHTGTAYKLSEILILKKNITTNEPIEELKIPKENSFIYDYALANDNDYFYEIKGIYKIYKTSEAKDFSDFSSYNFTGCYAYLKTLERIYISSSNLPESEIIGDYKGIYNFLKYHWNKIMILDTEKRLSEDTEDGLYYISKEPYSKWDFQLNLGDADVSFTTDAGTFEGLHQFPRVNETYRNFKTQSLTCGLGKIDNSTNWRYGRSSVNLVNEWQKFCNNGHVKILRDQYGNLLPVKITAKSYKCNNTKPMIMDISFDWTQLGPEENLVAIETYDGEVKK